MHILSTPSKSNNLSGRGRPKKFPDIPTSMESAYHMEEREILYHMQYHTGPILYAHFSLQFKDITGLPISREVVKDLAKSEVMQYACFMIGENFVIGPCVDLFLLRDPKAKAAFIALYAPGSILSTTASTFQPTEHSTSTTSEFQSQAQNNMDIVMATDGSDVLYDPRFDPDAESFEGVPDVFFDEDCVYGKFPLWRNSKTQAIAGIPRNDPYNGMNAENIDLYSQKSIDRLIANLPSTKGRLAIEEYNDSLPEDDD